MLLQTSLVSLATALKGGPKEYALLLGSGVSTGAGVPTGWQIAVELARRLPGAPHIEAELEQWFEDRHGQALTYSSILEALGTAPTERFNLLRPFFEPTSEEFENHIKVPSSAHKAIAELVRIGLVRVIITTNFDRLIEQALRDIGIEPTVISSDDALNGIRPYAFLDCLIIKVHGDYRDCRLLNTNAELASYSPRMTEFLRNILSDHGLITCGWSSDYDPALAEIVSQTSSKSISTYWLHKGPPGDRAQKIIETRSAVKIEIESADSAFEDTLSIIRSSAQPTETRADVSALTAKAKRILQDGKLIELSDLVRVETDSLLRELASDNFDLDRKCEDDKGWFNEFKRRVVAYEDATQRLAGVLSLVAYYGDEACHSILTKSLERVAEEPFLPRGRKSWGGVVLWTDLALYPSVLIFHGLTASAVAAERWGNLKPILRARVPDRAGEAKTVPTVVALQPHRPFGNDSKAQWLLQSSSSDRSKKYMPADDYIASKVKERLHDLGISDSVSERTIDIAFFLVQLAFQDVSEDEKYFSYCSPGQWWRVMSVFKGWQNSPQAMLIAQVESEQNQSPILRSGIGSNSAKKFLDRADQVKQYVERAMLRQ